MRQKQILKLLKSLNMGLVLILTLSACSNESDEIIPREEIKDIQNLPQNALSYTTDPSSNLAYFIAQNEGKISPQDTQETEDLKDALAKDYIQKFTSPWYEEPNPNMGEVFWILPSLLELIDFDPVGQEGAIKMNLSDERLQEVFKAWQEAKKDKPQGKEKPKFYGEDLQEIRPEFIKEIITNMNLSSYLCDVCAPQKAIITSTTDVRALPTNKPLFNKPNGYPFDRWQNSLIFANTPVLITHKSRDGRYAHIQSSYVYGWVEAESLALMSQEQISEFGRKGFFVPTRDHIPIQIQAKIHEPKGSLEGKNSVEGGFYLGEARIGQLFPVFQHDTKHTILTLYKRDSNGRAIPKHFSVYLDNDDPSFHLFPLRFREGKIAAMINTMLGQKYGWGGYLQNRDCSAFIRDIFTQFGLHLPRNSKAQVYYGKSEYNHEVISLKDLSSSEKEAYIIQHATPFKTILWQSGHIMLYIGHKDGRALIAHSAWSVTTGKKYENLLGGAVITSLHVGEEKNSSFATSPLLIDKIEAMSDLSTLAKLLESSSQTNSHHILESPSESSQKLQSKFTRPNPTPQRQPQ